MTDFVCKMHRIGADSVLAVADRSALGRKYADSRRTLDLDKFGAFYHGRGAGEAELLELFSQCTSANIVGPAAVAFAIKHGFAAKGDIVDIGGISHVQIYKIADAGQ